MDLNYVSSIDKQDWHASIILNLTAIFCYSYEGVERVHSVNGILYVGGNGEVQLVRSTMSRLRKNCTVFMIFLVEITNKLL